MNARNRLTKTVLILVLLLVIASVKWVTAQFTSEELKQRTIIEDLLKTSEITKSENIGEGVTKPYRLFMAKDGTEIQGCWKNPEGIQQGYPEGWQYEIAAYEMDKLIGLDMIPPTVEREWNGKKGSLQFWIHGGMNDLERMEQKIKIPDAHLDLWEKRKYLTRAFDCLIANEDRTKQNIRYTNDWRTILIDHSRAFRSSRVYTNRLIYGHNGIKEIKLIRKLPVGFVTRIRGLDIEMIREAAGNYLDDREIKAILKRRDLLLKEIDHMIKEQGKNNFLY